MSGNLQGEVERGRTIGKYELLTRLSVGGMAELYLAFLGGPGGFRKFVALKQILPNARRDETFVKMFLDEARITAGFHDPHIAQVFDLGVDEASGELYLAMEFIPGTNLEQVFKAARAANAPLPVSFACRVARDVCLGLHHAHTFVEPGTKRPAQVIHRDISPKNVMLSWAGAVKLIDFGIAKAKDRLQQTASGLVKGTTGYMAPEQLEDLSLDGRADVFATAVILYELLTMTRLYGRKGVEGLLEVLEGRVEPPERVNPDLPPAVTAVVMKGLEKNPDKRFATAREMARAIEQAAPSLADEEQLAATIGALLPERRSLTDSLLELASRTDADRKKLFETASAMRAPPEPTATVSERRTAPTTPARRGVAAAPDLQLDVTLREQHLETQRDLPPPPAEAPAKTDLLQRATFPAPSDATPTAPLPPAPHAGATRHDRAPRFSAPMPAAPPPAALATPPPVAPAGPAPAGRAEPPTARTSSRRAWLFVGGAAAAGICGVALLNIVYAWGCENGSRGEGSGQARTSSADDPTPRSDSPLAPAEAAFREASLDRARELATSCVENEKPCPGRDVLLGRIAREAAALKKLEAAEAALSIGRLTTALESYESEEVGLTWVFRDRRKALGTQLSTWGPGRRDAEKAFAEGDYKAAFNTLAGLPKQELKTWESALWAGMALSRLGEHAMAMKAFEAARSVAEEPVALAAIDVAGAAASARAGHDERAVELLVAAQKTGAARPLLETIKTDPDLAKVRGVPRVQDLLRMLEQ